MKKGWEMKKLGKICANLDNKRVPITKHKRSEGKYPYYGASGIVDYVEDYLFDEKLLLVSEDGANLLARTYPIAFSVSGKCWVNNHAHVLRFEEMTTQRFVEYYLNSIKLDKYISGMAQPKLNQQMLNSIEIPISSFLEQQRIVSILDEAFAAIDQAKENVQRNLQNAKELFQSELNNVFTDKNKNWDEKSLREVSLEFSRGKSKHRPRGDESILGGKYPLIQTSEIGNSNHWITTYSQTYNEKGLAQSKLWPKGTICIAIVGVNVAETAILDFEACFPDSVIGIVVNPKIANNEFVDFLLQFFKNYLKDKGKGTARDNLNLGTFENQNFPFPSVEIQEKIVFQLNMLAIETKKLEILYQQKLNSLEELKKGILQKAFSGELNEKELN